MRTLPRTLSVLAAAALAACATIPRVEGARPAGPPAMRVWIGYPIGGGWVHPIFVNREAHVAMFEIIPGRGVTMVYPRTRTSVFASDAHYADLSIQPGRMLYYTDPFGYANVQPRYYYVVASAAPLDLARLHSSLGSIRRVLGRMYGSFRPYDVIDRLTELVVPMQSDEDWATDLFVDWPFPVAPRAVLAQQFVRCANGRVIVVAANYPYFGCPGDTRQAVVATATESPIKELPVTAIPRRPQGSDGRRSVELSDSDIADGRRAMTGTRPPRVGGMARSPSEGGPRYSDEARSTRPAGEPTRATSAGEPSRAAEPSRGTAGKIQPAEPRAPTSSERDGQTRGTERKP